MKAYWIDVGGITYPEMYNIFLAMKRTHEAGEIPDTLVSAAHPLEISFGYKRHRNTFSNGFLEEVKKQKGRNTHADALDVLREKGIPFSYIPERPGGATVVGPGQAPFYITADWRRIRPPKMGADGQQRMNDISTWMELIDDVMKGVVSMFNVPVVHTTTSYHKTDEERRTERKDIWTTQNGSPVKLGARMGVADTQRVAGGFVFYVTHEGTRYTDIINNCGIPPEEVGAISIEEVAMRKPNLEAIKDYTKLEVARVFDYGRFETIPKEDFFEMIRPYMTQRLTPKPVI